MIRGAIEVAQKDRVAGWIYCEAETLRERLVLAFSGARCVGAGKVDRFRKDLFEADLGDGYCGYDFAINLEIGETIGSVVVKLQNSDAALISGESLIVGSSDGGASGEADLGPIPPASLAYLQDRGWIEQSEYDFLRGVQIIGAYERSLRSAKRPGGDTPPVARPEVVAADLFSVFNLAECGIGETRLASVSDLGGVKSPLRSSPCPIVAVWSAERGRVSVAERSHTGPAESRAAVLSEPPPGGVEYTFGPDRLLFLHRDLVLGPQGAAPAAGITLFTAVPKAAAKTGK